MIIRTTPDKEKVKSILQLIKEREEFIVSIDIEKFPTIAAETYYEIIKELAIALLLIKGQKAVGEGAHKEIVFSLMLYKAFTEDEVILVDDLRIKRNKSSYEGKKIDQSYLQNKKGKLLSVVNKLKKEIKNKL